MKSYFSHYSAMALLVCAMGCSETDLSGGEGEPGQTPVKPPPPQSQPLLGGDMPEPMGPIGGAPMNGAMLDAQLLVLSASGKEADLATIRQALDYLGTPYTLWVASAQPGKLTAGALASGTHGYYQGVIVATANLAASSTRSSSALSAAEWTALYNYEAKFAVRQVNWYTYPTAKRATSGSQLGQREAVLDQYAL